MTPSRRQTAATYELKGIRPVCRHTSLAGLFQFFNRFGQTPTHEVETAKVVQSTQAKLCGAIGCRIGSCNVKHLMQSLFRSCVLTCDATQYRKLIQCGAVPAPRTVLLFVLA